VQYLKTTSIRFDVKEGDEVRENEATGIADDKGPAILQAR